MDKYRLSAKNTTMDYVKIYVRVRVEFLSTGGIVPLSLFWKDGNEFLIDKVKLKERAPCKSGGVLPIRFTVMMQGKEKYLYYEREKERWFVEKEYQ